MLQERDQDAENTTQNPMEPLIMERLCKISDKNREFDIAFWQAQDAAARLNAGWELVEFYLKLKGRTDELRLQRTAESLQCKDG